MNSICWGYGWQEAMLCRWWVDANAAALPRQDVIWEPVACTGPVHARALIGDAFPHAPLLRAALEDASTDLARLNDARFIDQVAALLADGELVLYRKALTAAAARAPVQIGATAKKSAPGQSTNASVKSVIAPKFSVPHRSAPIAAEKREPADDWGDQALFAAALMQAAMHGEPLVDVPGAKPMGAGR